MKIEDIKFKAKRLDNQEWVKGDLIHSTNYIGIGYPSDVFSDVPIVHRVNPATVCQFTGLKDCKGNEIWEGDIVERVLYDIYKGYIQKKAVIEYRNGAFVTTVDRTFYPLLPQRIKVVGNKFDKEK